MFRTLSFIVFLHKQNYIKKKFKKKEGMLFVKKRVE